MSRYLARLKALIAKDTRTRLTDETDKSPCVSFVSDDGGPLRDNASAIEERAALAANSVPACYLVAWARLQCQRPLYATDEAWRRAIEDVGRFLCRISWRRQRMIRLPVVRSAPKPDGRLGRQWAKLRHTLG
jgi:hypothetical protein